MEFYKEDAFIAGVETPACIVSSLRDLRLSCFTRHFGHRLGRVRVNSTLHSACSKIGRAGWKGDAPTEFYMVERSFTGVETPACILSSLRDYACMGGWGGDAPMEFYMVERCLAGVETPACILSSLRDYVGRVGG